MLPLSLARRLYTAEGLLAATLLVLGLGLRWSLARRDAALLQSRFATDYGQSVRGAGLSCRRYLEAVLGARDIAGARPAAKELLRGLGRSRTVAGNVGLKEEADELERMTRFVRASDVLLARVQRLRREGRREEAAELYRTGLQPLAAEYLARSLEQRLGEEQAWRSRTLAELNAWTDASFALALSGGALAFLLLGLWTRRLAAYLSANLERIRRALAAIASGNFDVRLAHGRDDEVGRLTAAVNEMAERLQRTQKRVVEIERQAALGQLARGAAQALANPLAAVVGYSDLLLQREGLDAKTRDDLQVVREQARRCEIVLGDLRRLSEPPGSSRQRQDLNERLGRLLDFLRPSFAAAGAALEARLESRLPPVQANAGELDQVFHHLLRNALQAVQGRPSPRVVVSTWSQEDRVILAIDDNGEGIAPEHVPRVFEPFFTTRPSTEGIGLGLASAYAAVRAHGGEIRVRSDPGRGSRFEVWLPRNGSPAPGAAAPGETAGRIGQRILVVDDEPEILALVSRVLRREGFEVRCAPNPEDGLRAAAAEPFDLVLSDYRMPGMDGVQLYEALSHAQPGAAVAFLFSTGEIVSNDFQSFADTHRIPVLLKPFDLDELVSIVRKSLLPGAAREKVPEGRMRDQGASS